MDHFRLPSKRLALTAALVALAAWYVIPVPPAAAVSKAKEAATSRALPQVSLSMTSRGIVVVPGTLKGGDYLLTIKNSTSEPRGVEMIGIDRASSPTVRYTKILQPKKSEAFRWYFAKGKTVYVRDIMSCGHDQRNCMMVTFGQMRKAIDVN